MAIKKIYTEEFLQEYKKLELLLQKIYGPDTTVRDVEVKLTNEGNPVANKMYVCRVIRNYASHNPDINDFMPIASEACDYLRSLYSMFESEVTTVKNKISRVKALTKKDNLAYAAQRLAKTEMMPVVNEDGYLIGLFTREILRKCIADEMSIKKKLTDVKLQSVPANICKKTTDSMHDLREQEEKTFIVTDNGRTSGKYLGMVIIDD